MNICEENKLMGIVSIYDHYQLRGNVNIYGEYISWGYSEYSWAL